MHQQANACQKTISLFIIIFFFLQYKVESEYQNGKEGM